MGRKRIDLTGDTFERLKVLEAVGQAIDNRNYLWLCECVCGEYTIVRSYNLRAGITRSCGCLHPEACRKINGIHLCSKTPEYVAWQNMHCKAAMMGLPVCERWKSLSAFFLDIGRRPSPEMKLTRIDKNIGYFVENLVWK